MTTNFRQSWI